MINMRIISNFITMMLINHIFNMHSSNFLKITILFPLLLGCPKFKLVQIGENRSKIIEYFPLST